MSDQTQTRVRWVLARDEQASVRRRPDRHAPVALRRQPAAPMDLYPLVELVQRPCTMPRRGLAFQARARILAITSSAVRFRAELVTRGRRSRPSIPPRRVELRVFDGAVRFL